MRAWASKLKSQVCLYWAKAEVKGVQKYFLKRKYCCCDKLKQVKPKDKVE